MRRVKPGPEDAIRIQSAVDLVISRLKDLDAEVHGSFRKGTWLKGDTDVDLFVFYPRSVGKEYLAREALREILDRLQGLRTRLAYAEHPYVIVEVDGVEVDVVPALRVESGDQAITAVDRTPFHTRYVTSRLSDEGKDQVRLLKRFLKGIGVYGAEIRVMGFSGYVAELLTIVNLETRYRDSSGEGNQGIQLTPGYPRSRRPQEERRCCRIHEKSGNNVHSL